MTELLRGTESRLVDAGICDPRLESQLLWMAALGLDRTNLFSHLGTKPRIHELRKAETLLERRLRHEPTAYLTGTREFFGLDFAVAPGVLIPRPETETVVEEALRLLKQRLSDHESPVVADVGTGSGILAISLAIQTSHGFFYATDVSERALQIAALNAMRHGVQDRIHLIHGDLLDRVDQPLDLVVANLPYVASSEIPFLDPEICLYEPLEALNGGPGGLTVIGRLMQTAGPHLLPGASIILELDPRQIDEAGELANTAFPGALTRKVRDLAGNPRVLIVNT